MSHAIVLADWPTSMTENDPLRLTRHFLYVMESTLWENMTLCTQELDIYLDGLLWYLNIPE